MSNVFAQLFRTRSDRLLPITTGVGVPSDAVPFQGVLLSPEGALLASTETPSYVSNGIPFDVSGRVCMALDNPAYWSCGIPFSSGGQIAVGANDLGYLDQGVAFNTGGRMMVIETSTPIYDPAAFVIRIDTTLTVTGSSPASSVRIPFRQSSAYDFDIDWGDGNVERVTTTGVPYVQHDYTQSGTYTIQIKGIFPRINYYSKASNDKSKAIEILQWGDIIWENLATAFAGCSNVQGNWTDAPIFSSLTYTPSMFLDCDVFNYPINFNMGTVTFMVGMFRNALAFDQDISQLNVSQLTDAENMLNGSAFSKANYDLLLNEVTGWPSRPVQPNVRFHAGSAKYSPASQVGRDILTNAPNFWVITDGGVDSLDFNQSDFLAGDFA